LGTGARMRETDLGRWASVTAASREAALGSTRSRNEDRHRQYVRHEVRTNPPPRVRTATHGTVPTVNGPGRMIRTGRAETSARGNLRQQSIATPRGEFTFAKCGRRKSHSELGRREGPDAIASKARCRCPSDPRGREQPCVSSSRSRAALMQPPEPLPVGWAAWFASDLPWGAAASIR
jgi:hypothetical protein